MNTRAWKMANCRAVRSLEGSRGSIAVSIARPLGAVKGCDCAHASESFIPPPCIWIRPLCCAVVPDTEIPIPRGGLLPFEHNPTSLHVRVTALAHTTGQNCHAPDHSPQK